MIESPDTRRFDWKVFSSESLGISSLGTSGSGKAIQLDERNRDTLVFHVAEEGVSFVVVWIVRSVTFEELLKLVSKLLTVGLVFGDAGEESGEKIENGVLG